LLPGSLVVIVVEVAVEVVIMSEVKVEEVVPNSPMATLETVTPALDKRLELKAAVNELESAATADSNDVTSEAVATCSTYSMATEVLRRRSEGSGNDAASRRQPSTPS